MRGEKAIIDPLLDPDYLAMDEKDRALFALINQHRGLKSYVSSFDLQEATGLNVREIRKRCEAWRKKDFGRYIVATPGHGYSIAENEEQFRRYLTTRRRAAIALLRNLADLERRPLAEITGQLVLDFVKGSEEVTPEASAPSNGKAKTRLPF